MTQYVVRNNTQGTLEITDSNNVQHAILAGSSLAVDLNASEYNSAVANVGAANVTPVVTNAYRYAVQGLVPVATPTDIIIMQGSATQVVRIKRIRVGGAATGQGNFPFTVVRRSSAGTLSPAVLTAIAAAKIDTSDAAATAVVSSVGTGNYGTLGTLVATLGARRAGLVIGVAAGGAGVGGDYQTSVFDTDEDASMPWVLRGTSDFLCINGGGAALQTGTALDIEIDTTESSA